jgi:hypothetical protein
MRFLLLSPKSQVIEGPTSSPPDPVAEAHLEMNAAEAACKAASEQRNAYQSRSLTYGPKVVNGVLCFQLDEDPVRLRLSAEAARARDEFQRRLKVWNDLKDKSNEAVHIGGVLVSR